MCNSLLAIESLECLLVRLRMRWTQRSAWPTARQRSPWNLARTSAENRSPTPEKYPSILGKTNAKVAAGVDAMQTRSVSAPSSGGAGIDEMTMLGTSYCARRLVRAVWSEEREFISVSVRSLLSGFWDATYCISK